MRLPRPVAIFVGVVAFGGFMVIYMFLIQRFFLLAVGGGMLFILAGMITAYRAGGYLDGQKRRSELSHLARTIGMRFERGNDARQARLLGPIFGSAEWPAPGAYVQNPIRGSLRVSGRVYGVTMGDFSYYQEQARVFQSAIVLEPPFRLLQRFAVSRGLMNREQQTSNAEAIELESDEFNRTFCITGDQRLASDVLHPMMMRYLLEVPTPPSIRVGPALICITGSDGGDGIWSMDDFRKWLAWSHNFIEQWPEHLAVAEPATGSPGS
jgi:hypothetical protein